MDLAELQRLIERQQQDNDWDDDVLEDEGIYPAVAAAGGGAIDVWSHVRRLPEPEIVKALSDTTLTLEHGLRQADRDENRELLSNYKLKHTYIGNYPYHKSPGWHNNVQGITHDDRYWYITQETRIWKIPATMDLARTISCHTPGVLCRDMSDTVLARWNFDHFGDLTYHKGYLAIGVTGPGRWGIVAFFTADGLIFERSFAPRDLESGNCCGFAGVDSKGYTYSSNNHYVNKLTKYRVNWDAMGLVGGADQGWFQKVGDVYIFDENWNELSLLYMQGATFSDDDKFLYLINGYYNYKANSGIHVFKLYCGNGDGDCIAYRFAKSTNGHGLFNYEFHTDARAEEPQGITYWDLTKPGSPRIRNNKVASTQLHALLLDNDWPDSDEIYIKHYKVEKTPWRR